MTTALAREYTAAAAKAAHARSYAALYGFASAKLLALHAGLNGLVACMARSYPAQQLRLAQDSLESLRRCAMRHLGQQPHTTLIRADRPQELQRLALQWLENACTISAPGTFSALPSIPKAGFPTYIAQSH